MSKMAVHPHLVECIFCYMVNISTLNRHILTREVFIGPMRTRMEMYYREEKIHKKTLKDELIINRTIEYTNYRNKNTFIHLCKSIEKLSSTAYLFPDEMLKVFFKIFMYV